MKEGMKEEKETEGVRDHVGVGLGVCRGEHEESVVK